MPVVIKVDVQLKLLDDPENFTFQEDTSMFPSFPHSSLQQDQIPWVALDLPSLVLLIQFLNPVTHVFLYLPSTLSVGPDGQPVEFDGKRLRKTMMRKTVDYNSSFINMLHNRVNPLVLILIIQWW